MGITGKGTTAGASTWAIIQYGIVMGIALGLGMWLIGTLLSRVGTKPKGEGYLAKASQHLRSVSDKVTTAARNTGSKVHDLVSRDEVVVVPVKRKSTIAARKTKSTEVSA